MNRAATIAAIAIACLAVIMPANRASAQICYDCQATDPEHPQCWVCQGEAQGSCEFCTICVWGSQGDSCLEDDGCYWKNFEWHCGQVCGTMGTCEADDCDTQGTPPVAAVAPLPDTRMPLIRVEANPDVPGRKATRQVAAKLPRIKSPGNDAR